MTQKNLKVTTLLCLLAIALPFLLLLSEPPTNQPTVASAANSDSSPSATTPVSTDPIFDNQFTKRCCIYIPHAAGAFPARPYTNSKENLLKAIHTGYKIIEIDFLPTSDDVWVAMHYWRDWSMQTGSTSAIPPTYKTFQESSYTLDLQGDGRRPLTPLSLNDIDAILGKHPDIRIIVDTKSKKKRAALYKRISDLPNAPQYILSAYRFRHFKEIRSFGFRNIVFQTYRKHTKTPADELLFKLQKPEYKPNAIFTPLNYYKRNQQFLAKSPIPAYVHGPLDDMNSHSTIKKLANLGASGMFIDWYEPPK